MPRKERDLFDGIASFQALLEAALRAARGKRDKPGDGGIPSQPRNGGAAIGASCAVAATRPGRYWKIEIADPRHHIVSAAPFRDRLVRYAMRGVRADLRAWLRPRQLREPVGQGHAPRIARYEQFRDRSRHVRRCGICRYFRPLTTRYSNAICPSVVLRGGSRNNGPRNLRPANRKQKTPPATGTTTAVSAWPARSKAGTVGATAPAGER